MAVTRQSSIGYIPALDGLRAFSIVAILVHHSHVPVPVLGEGGKLGVDVFFVVSGYLITTILLSGEATAGRPPIQTFYRNRLVRLAPPLMIVLLVTLVPGLVWDPDGPVRFGLAAVAAATYLTPVTMAFHWSGAFEHTWSLGLEEYFYLTFPAFLAVSAARPSLRKPLLLAAGLLGLLMSGLAHARTGDPSAVFDFLRVGAIAWGCALALHLRDRPGVVVPSLTAPLGGVLVIAGMTLAAYGGRLAGFGSVLVAAGACALVAAAVSRTGVIVRCLAATPSRFIGIVSYELYLWHYPVLLIGAWATGAQVWATATWAYPVSLLLAIVTERACRRLRVRLRSAPPATGVVVAAAPAR